MESRPLQPDKAVLLITGAWHIPEHYRKVTSRLEAQGVRVLCPRLPTNNNVVPPNRTLADDVACIRDVVAREAAAGTHLTVLVHSYGGVVASAALGDFALPPPLSPDSKQGGGGRSGVANLLFMSAFIPTETQSLAGIFGGQTPPYLTSDPETNTIVWTDPIDHLYNDLPAEEAALAESMRVAHSHDAQHTPISDCLQGRQAAWRTAPSVAYLVCQGDQALPAFMQEIIMGRVRGEGVKVRGFTCGGGHSPFLSMPDQVVKVVIEILQG